MKFSKADFWTFRKVLYTLLHLPPSDFSVLEDAGTEHRTVVTLALAVRGSNRAAKYLVHDNVEERT